ncbi:hypothetical protein TNCV_3047591 [Trichonephila clavipes]|nr:hypothetical protein TNCV_3047591 [Trichonephila clavipes]
MTWCIVVHEKELQTHSASKKTHIWKKNLVTITVPLTEPASKLGRSVRLPSMMPPQTKTPRPPYLSLSMMFEG